MVSAGAMTFRGMPVQSNMRSCHVVTILPTIGLRPHLHKDTPISIPAETVPLDVSPHNKCASRAPAEQEMGSHNNGSNMQQQSGCKILQSS